MSDTDSSRRRPSERRQLGVGRKGLIMKRILLACGIVAGPLFIAASLTQASTHRGFDLARHPISLLSLGSLGWIQIANFVVCGILYVIGAVGLRTALRSGRGITWVHWLIGTTGVGLIIAGVFTADPGAGFPPGAPAGAPAMSWHGALHEVGFLLSFAGAIAACGVFARRYAALKSKLDGGGSGGARGIPRRGRLARSQHTQRAISDRDSHPVRVPDRSLRPGAG